jgi:hypothetical protein
MCHVLGTKRPSTLSHQMEAHHVVGVLLHFPPNLPTIQYTLRHDTYFPLIAFSAQNLASGFCKYGRYIKLSQCQRPELVFMDAINVMRCHDVF